MSIDVVDLRNFYGQRLGVVARRFIGRGIRAQWRETAGLRVLGIGYATPYLGLFREEAERCLAFMPAGQGVVKWPTTRPALSTLVDECEMPLPDAAVDRVLLVHALEMTTDPSALLREVWRVLAAGGRPAGGGAEPPRAVGAHGHDAVRPWPALFAHADQPAAARDLVHADRLGRGLIRAADRARLVPALGRRLGAHRRDAVGAVCRRASGGGDQAGLSGDSGAARTAADRAGAQAGAGAVAGGVKRAKLFAGLSWRLVAAVVRRRRCGALRIGIAEIRAVGTVAAAAMAPPAAMTEAVLAIALVVAVLRRLVVVELLRLLSAAGDEGRQAADVAVTVLCGRLLLIGLRWAGAVALVARRKRLRVARQLRLRLLLRLRRVIRLVLAEERLIVVAVVVIVIGGALRRVLALLRLLVVVIRILLAELFLRGGDQAEIMFGVLVVVFRGHRIAGTLRVARELDVFFATCDAVPRIFTSGPFDS